MMYVFSIRLPSHIVEKIDQLVEQGLYANRSEFIREAIRIHLDRLMGLINNIDTRVVRRLRNYPEDLKRIEEKLIRALEDG